MVENIGRQSTTTVSDKKPQDEKASPTNQGSDKASASGAANSRKKTTRSKAPAKRAATPRKRTTRSTRITQPARAKITKQGVIILPAIKDGQDKKTTRKRTAKQSAPKTRKTTRTSTSEQQPSKPLQEQTPSPKEQITGEVSHQSLPVYHARTNGLKELLSAIDPDEKSYQQQAITAEPSLPETPMFIPHTRPCIPGSPDLPVGPTRWGLYASVVAAALAMVFVSALAYSHFSSPNGIDWVKLQSKTSDVYQWLITTTRADKKPEIARPTVAENDGNTNEPTASAAHSAKTAKQTQIATASRISTTAASPKRGTIKIPSSNEIFISAEELEDQIQALERTGISLESRASIAVSKSNLQEFERRQDRVSIKIDPKTENQIFARASSYLKQRDISSARMILQYAATLGSGVSAMALAETFDPRYLKRTNLHGVVASPLEARKWYKTAARLGVREAKERLTALK